MLDRYVSPAARLKARSRLIASWIEALPDDTDSGVVEELNANLNGVQRILAALYQAHRPVRTDEQINDDRFDIRNSPNGCRE